MTRTISLRTLGAGFAVAALAVLVSACAPSDGESAGSLVVRDQFIRKPDTACSGSGNMSAIHKGGRLTISDGHGTVLVDTELVSGTALRADDIDYGPVPRVPTVCSFAVDISALKPDTTYTLHVDQHRIGESKVRTGKDGRPTISYPDDLDPAAVLGGDS